MSSVVISGDTSGTVTLTVPAVAGTNTITVPANTGTMVTTASSAVVTQAMLSTNVSGNGPAFSAYASADQNSISSNVPTKVNFANEEYDTNSNFASNRFTPTVAGYYQLTYRISTGAQYGIAQLFKNGTAYGVSCSIQGYGQGYDSCTLGSSLVYANGTTDYFEVYIIISSGSLKINGSVGAGQTLATSFQGAMVRGA